MKKSSARDMTVGSPLKNIIFFSLPLVVGTLFQQVYTIADSVIVAKFVGEVAFAGVGCTGSIFFLILGFALGLCSGVAIPAAQDFGAGDLPGVRKCAANSIYIGVGIAVALSVLVCSFTDEILSLMNTTPETYEYAKDYLFSLAVGITATVLYNLAAGMLRALGDSRTPLYFLIICSFLNVGLDLLFITQFNMGVAGAGYATVLSQGISFVLCVAYIALRFPLLHLKKQDFIPDGTMIRRMLGIGIPMGLQASIISIGSIVLQRAVNSLGTVYVTAMSAGFKVQNIVGAPMDAVGIAMANYAGQNFGAGRIDRIRDGMRKIFVVMMGYSVCGFLINFLLGNTIALIFIDRDSTDVLRYIHLFLTINGAFLPMLAIIFITRYTLQGIGFSKTALLAGISEMAARSIVAEALVSGVGFIGVCFANPAAWVCAAAVLSALYLRNIRRVEARFSR